MYFRHTSKDLAALNTFYLLNLFRDMRSDVRWKRVLVKVAI